MRAPDATGLSQDTVLNPIRWHEFGYVSYRTAALDVDRLSDHPSLTLIPSAQRR
jgi:hypothetical protein